MSRMAVARSSRPSLLRVVVAVALFGSAAFTPLHAATLRVAMAAQPAQEGRITGRVVDASTGQGLAAVEVTIVGTTLGSRTDLDGRYTILRVPPGAKSVIARRIGRQPKKFDGVVVTAGEAAVVNFSLGEVSVELQSVVVSAAATDRSATGASLLASQQRAASASDGISAEQIKRTPDSNAGEAATRVSGVSVVDGKFLVARGLSERYSTTLLNGAEVASPEPTRKLVPLDVFPASLLESIVVTKSATPDKPGDFSGGAVEIRTKEFPENTIRQFTLSQGYNSQATFQSLPFPARSGLDFIGVDNGRREPSFRPANNEAFRDPFVTEQFAEGIRNTWNPARQRVLPKLGLSATLGGQRPSERAQLGYVFSLTYSAAADRQADRFFGFYASPVNEPERGFVYQDYRNTVDWGGVGNLSMRLGKNSKLSWKNLYTRNAEELYSESDGFNVDTDGNLRLYQFQYVERNLVQSQIAGEHLFPAFRSSRLEWKATVGQSGRNEPDNRQVRYDRNAATGDFRLLRNNDAWIRSLNDQTRSAQVDFTVPLRFLFTDFTFKSGALARTKTRKFVGELWQFSPNLTVPLPNDLLSLPPDKLFQPETLGSLLVLQGVGSVSQSYDADDDITAAYGMLDLFLGGKLRVVTGARLEAWRMDLFDGGRELFDRGDTTSTQVRRRDRDVLLSTNATYALSDRANLRLAAFQSVSRPDTRELSRDEYTETAGSCSTIGNPALQRGKVANADARLEWYPRPGEVLSASGFYKRFSDPIIRLVTGRNNCTYEVANAESANTVGVEAEMRKDLTFLPSVLSRLSASFNLTLVRTSVVISPTFGSYDPGLDLEGQSPYVVNAGLAYASRTNSLSASILYNVFGDRIVRYGFASSSGANTTQGPNILERGRSSLDAKVQRVFSERFSMSLSAKNLTNQRVQYFQAVSTGQESTGRATPGISVDLGVSIAR